MRDPINLTQKEEEFLLGMDTALTVGILSTCGLAVIHGLTYVLATVDRYLMISPITCMTMLVTGLASAGLLLHRLHESNQILKRHKKNENT